MTLRPTNELVIKAWLDSVPELAGYPVAFNPITNDSWQAAGAYMMVRVSAISGTPSPYFPERMPRVVVSCYALPKRWADANQLAEIIRDSTYASNSARVVVPRPEYDQANVLSIETASEPIRVEGDVDKLARYDIWLDVRWIPVGLVIT